MDPGNKRPVTAGEANGRPRKEAADSLDLSSFLTSLEKEVGDLHKSIKWSRDERLEKAFQRVPRSMRRRTASHNAKKLPRRLWRQARRDQIKDNTPSVAASQAKRKKAWPASAWVYENTKKRMRRQQEGKLAARQDEDELEPDDSDDDDDNDGGAAVAIGPRRPLPIANLRLPTHRWHAKRAQMDNPGFLWNTTVVRTPANKTYRMSLQAARLRPGMCVSWDTSFVATIYVTGPAPAVDEALASVVEPHLLALSGSVGCIDAKLPRSFGYQHTASGLAGPGNCNAMTVVYNPAGDAGYEDMHDDSGAAAGPRRQVFLRVHPTLFSHVWTTLGNAVARRGLPVTVRDYRLEVGSIDVTGSAAAATLAAALYPYDTDARPMEAMGCEFLKLRRIDTAALAPASGAMLAFSIQDPRLDEPVDEPCQEAGSSRNGVNGRTGTNSASSAAAELELTRILTSWPATDGQRPSGLFETAMRHDATKLSPQAVMDKRRGKLATGERLLLRRLPATAAAASRPIPVVMAAVGSAAVAAAAAPITGHKSSAASATWTLLAPRGCIDVIHHRLHGQRLDGNGQRPVCAGVEEAHHMALERGTPWFPADFPGTPTGWDWELQSRRREAQAWAKKPTAKRPQWDAVDAGNGTKGELGSGFACDWEHLFNVPGVPSGLAAGVDSGATETGVGAGADMLEEQVQFEALRPGQTTMPVIVRDMQHVTWSEVRAAVQAMRRSRQRREGREAEEKPAWRVPYPLMTVSVQLVSGGTPDARARIYRLPGAREADESPSSNLRARWLALADSKHSTSSLSRRMPASADMATRTTLLAQSLLDAARLPLPSSAAGSTHVPLPGSDDLMGFVTSGAQRAQTGKGFGIGHVSAQKLAEAVVAADSADADADADADANTGPRRGSVGDDARFCIVRNAGESVGRLARWTPISH